MEPFGHHLKPGDLALGTESVLAAGEHPQARAWFAVEREHDVDGVLQSPGAGEIAVLGYVAGEHDGYPLGLRKAYEGVGAQPDLRRPARKLVAGGIAKSLYRVHSEQERLHHPGRFQDDPQLSSGDEGDGLGRDAEAPGPQGDLIAGFLARGKEAGEPGGRQVRDQLEEKGRLAEFSSIECTERAEPWDQRSRGGSGSTPA